MVAHDDPGSQPAVPLSRSSRALLGLLNVLTFVFERLSIDRGVALGAAFGRVWDRMGAPRTRRVRDQLAMAMPDVDVVRREEWAREVFVHFGRGLAELVILRGRRRRELLDRVEVEGLEHVEAAERLSPSGGVVMVTAHCGNWELACAKVASMGIPMSVVYRNLRQPALDEMLLGIRGAGQRSAEEASRLEQIPMGRAGIRFVRALDAGRKVLVLLDQDARPEEGVFVSFFDRPASTRGGPLALAALRGVPVLPAFVRRSPDGRTHSLRIQAALQLEDGASDEEEVLRRNVQRVTAVIEKEIRESPGQWIWTHRRWRTQPPLCDDDHGPP